MDKISERLSLMHIKLRFFLTGCLLLLCLMACTSNNNSSSTQTASAPAPANTQSGPANVMQPTSVNETAAAPNAPPLTPEQQAAANSAIDACTLITNKEVAKLQGAAIKEAKSNRRLDGEFLMSQCFYTAEEFVRSVSLTVIQPNPTNPSKHPREYFTEKFRAAEKEASGEREKEREKERARERKERAEGEGEKGRGAEEEEEEGANTERVRGLGDSAYWVKTGPTASLYVLKKDQFIILSIGGGDPEPVKLKKTKTLAQQALKRLK